MMKKIYAIMIGVVLASTASAQYAKQRPTLLKKTPFTETSSKHRPVTNTKAAVLWNDEFNDPSQWMIYNEAGNQQNWVIDTVSPSGDFKIPKIKSTSGGNFALYDSDALGSDPNTQNAMVQYKNTINLTGYNKVALQFEEQYRHFQDMTFVEVSTDGGTVWTSYQVNKTIPVNGSVATNPTIVLVDISASAGNNANVLIRFRFEGEWDYSWMVDDVKIVETPGTNLTITSSFHGDIFDDYEYRQIPLSQSHPLLMGAIVANDGGESQANVKLNYSIKNLTTGGPAITYSTAPATLGIGAVDTLSYEVPKLTEAGDYEITMDLVCDNTDATPENNKVIRLLKITDGQTGTLSHGAPSWGGNYYAPWDAAAPDTYEPLIYMNNYRIYEAGDKIYSTTTVLTDLTTADQEINVELFKYQSATAPDPDNKTSLGSFTYTITSADLSANVPGTPVTLNFPTAITLDKDAIYGITVQAYGGSDAFSIATSGTDNDGGSIIYINNGGTTTWYGLGSSPMITMNLGSPTGINEKAKSKVSINAYPNPAKDRLNVNFSLDKAQQITFTLNDVTGKVVYTKSATGTTGANVIKLEQLNLRPGVYFYNLSANGTVSSNKIVISE